jgi:hypothetical protein
MDACDMVARCHQHQYPEDYGRPAPGPIVWTPELVVMTVDREPEAPRQGEDRGG